MLIQFLAGATTSVSVYYVLSTGMLYRTATISNDLQALASEVKTISSRPTVSAYTLPSSSPSTLREQIISRWNQQIESAVSGAYRTNYSRLAGDVIGEVQELTGRLTSSLQTPQAPSTPSVSSRATASAPTASAGIPDGVTSEELGLADTPIEVVQRKAPVEAKRV